MRRGKQGDRAGIATLASPWVAPVGREVPRVESWTSTSLTEQLVIERLQKLRAVVPSAPTAYFYHRAARPRSFVEWTKRPGFVGGLPGPFSPRLRYRG